MSPSRRTDEMAPGRTPSSDRPPRRLGGPPLYERENVVTGAILETSNADAASTNESEGPKPNSAVRLRARAGDLHDAFDSAHIGEVWLPLARGERMACPIPASEAKGAP